MLALGMVTPGRTRLLEYRTAAFVEICGIALPRCGRLTDAIAKIAGRIDGLVARLARFTDDSIARLFVGKQNCSGRTDCGAD